LNNKKKKLKVIVVVNTWRAKIIIVGRHTSYIRHELRTFIDIIEAQVRKPVRGSSTQKLRKHRKKAKYRRVKKEERKPSN